MSGHLLWALAAFPFAAAIVVGLVWGESARRVVSLIMIGAASLLALTAAVTANTSDTGLECRATVDAWRIGSAAVAPSFGLSLDREWSLAPLLLFGLTFALLGVAPVSQHAVIHWQAGTALAVVLLSSPMLGMAAVSASTVAAVVQASSAGKPFGLRWIVADAVIWMSLIGLLGGSVWPIIVGIAIRASLFPFHSGLVHAIRSTSDVGLILIPVPAAVWAFRWLDPLPSSSGSLAWEVAAAIVPAMLALGEASRLASIGYRVAAVMAWPLLLPNSPPFIVAVAGFGIASALLNPASGWRSICAAAAMIVPVVKLGLVQPSSPPSATFCLAVSASAFLVQWNRPEADDERSPLASEFVGAWIAFAAAASLAVAAK